MRSMKVCGLLLDQVSKDKHATKLGRRWGGITVLGDSTLSKDFIWGAHGLTET